MKIIDCFYLRRLIFFHINPFIEEYREANGCNKESEVFLFATDEEVNVFIASSPYYSNELRQFLYRNDDTEMSVSKEWLVDFLIKTEQWTDRKEWIRENAMEKSNPIQQRFEIGLCWPVAS